MIYIAYEGNMAYFDGTSAITYPTWKTTIARKYCVELSPISAFIPATLALPILVRSYSTRQSLVFLEHEI
jgi:hypothetical protein